MYVHDVQASQRNFATIACICIHTIIHVPCTIRLAEASEGLLLFTMQVYSPCSVWPLRVWVYCAVTGSSNTVSVPSVTVSESLVQVTVVAGPPVEIQVRVN